MREVIHKYGHGHTRTREIVRVVVGGARRHASAGECKGVHVAKGHEARLARVEPLPVVARRAVAVKLGARCDHTREEERQSSAQNEQHRGQGGVRASPGGVEVEGGGGGAVTGLLLCEVGHVPSIDELRLVPPPVLEKVHGPQRAEDAKKGDEGVVGAGEGADEERRPPDGRGGEGGRLVDIGGPAFGADLREGGGAHMWRRQAVRRGWWGRGGRRLDWWRE